jgi:gluconolactonase
MRRLVPLLLFCGCVSETASPDLGMVDLSSFELDEGLPQDLAVDMAYPDPLAGTGSPTEVKGGFQFLEGPLWRAADGVLLFSDTQASIIYKLTPPNTVTNFRTNSGAANGNAVDQNGLLITCEGANKRVTRTQANGTVVAVTSMYNGAAYNSPNDVIVRSDGTIYFTDPSYGGTKTQPGEYVYRVSPAGMVSTVDTTLTRPNGITLSPDEKTPYVADEPNSKIVKYTVNADGSTSANGKFTDTSGNPDGITTDDAGNVYASTAAGIEVYRANGTKIGTVSVPKQPANCAFGGAERKTLYITARASLYAVQLNVPGKP